MTSPERVVSVGIGVAGIIWAFVPGMTFYSGGFGISNKKKPIPKWIGRIWFIIIGLGFIYLGLRK
jgi:hypothetical protein